MERREFITLIGGAAFAWPGAALGQQPNQVRRIGVLMYGSETQPDYPAYLAAFVDGLRQLGWIEGHDLRIDVRWSASNTELARAYSAELSIFAARGRAIHAADHANGTCFARLVQRFTALRIVE
jgi:putative ABC transport system substrate-binding protein